MLNRCLLIWTEVLYPEIKRFSMMKLFLSHWTLFHSNDRIYTRRQIPLCIHESNVFLSCVKRITICSSVADRSGHTTVLQKKESKGKYFQSWTLETSQSSPYPSLNLMPEGLQNLKATSRQWQRLQTEGSLNHHVKKSLFGLRSTHSDRTSIGKILTGLSLYKCWSCLL